MRGIIGAVDPHEAPKTLRFGKRPAILLLAVAILGGAAATRSFEYDEAYSVFVTSPTPRPAWPATVFRAGDARAAFASHAGPIAIARALRETDVHPPLYFWLLAAWRQVAGDGLFAMRLLSVTCALVALGAVGSLAREAGIPVASAMLLTLGCYGFAYTGVVARGFALAQALTLCGVLLLVRAARVAPPAEPDAYGDGSPPSPRHARSASGMALGGGLLLGAATLTNYLSVFVAVAALLWLLLGCWRRPRLWLAAGIGFSLFLLANLMFFLAQRNARVGQFPPFRLGPSLVRLAGYATANLFGGLPLYVGGPARTLVAAVLGVTVAGLMALIAWRWRALATPRTRILLAGCMVAPPLGLLVLGALFDSTPIELRYLCFATPFAGMLLAAALAAAPWGRRLRSGVLILQALSLLGLALRAETMQPARAAARSAAALAGSDGVVILPRGNDGVGVVGPFLAELPDVTPVLLVRPEDDPESVRGRVPHGPVVLALLGEDAASVAALRVMRAAFGGTCWHISGRGFATTALAPNCAAQPMHLSSAASP